MRHIKNYRSELGSTLGVDGDLESLGRCKDTYDELVLADVRTLPFGERTFDVALCLDVLEYLNRSEGCSLIDSLEKIAKERVVLSTPIGTGTSYGAQGGPYMRSVRSTWQVKELRDRGYRIYGNRPKFVVGDHGLRSPMLRILACFADVVPFYYYCPPLAGHMVCIKNIGVPSTHLPLESTDARS